MQPRLSIFIRMGRPAACANLTRLEGIVAPVLPKTVLAPTIWARGPGGRKLDYFASRSSAIFLGGFHASPRPPNVRRSPLPTGSSRAASAVVPCLVPCSLVVSRAGVIRSESCRFAEWGQCVRVRLGTGSAGDVGSQKPGSGGRSISVFSTEGCFAPACLGGILEGPSPAFRAKFPLR